MQFSSNGCQLNCQHNTYDINRIFKYTATRPCCYLAVAFCFATVSKQTKRHHSSPILLSFTYNSHHRYRMAGRLIPRKIRPKLLILGVLITNLWARGLAAMLYAYIMMQFVYLISKIKAFSNWIDYPMVSNKSLYFQTKIQIEPYVPSGEKRLNGCISIRVLEYPEQEVLPAVSEIPDINNLGSQLIAAILGYYVRYYYVSLIAAIFPATMLISCFFLPETPSNLILKGRETEATKVLKKLRGSHVDVHHVIDELREINSGTKDGGWGSLLQKDVLKRLLVIFFLFFFNVFSGTTVLVFFASRVMKTSGSSINEELCTIILMLVQLVSVFFMGPLMDYLGRKKTLVGSFMVMCLSLGTLAYYSWVTEGLATNHIFVITYGWIPLASLIVCLMAASLGATPIPFIIAGEYFPTSIRSQTSAVWMSARTGFTFLSLQLYSPMVLALTPKGLYGFYSLVCLLGVPYVICMVEETKGKNVG
ncbi:unnamed protein product, partial [Meganyctiphanes norvegica]